MRFKAMHAVGLICLTLTSAAPPPPLPARPKAWALRRDSASPVRCNADDRDDSRFGKRGYRGRSLMVPMMAPPSMLVPAPSPAMEPSVATPVVVTAQPPANGSVASVPMSVAPIGSPDNTERYDGKPVASIQSVASAPVSTFSIDVDTGSYANVRRFLNRGQIPPADAVRTEEMINYFRYDYPRPSDRDEPFSVTTDVARTPWNPDSRLLRIGLRGYDVATDARPPANLVFLVDVSGSMDEPDKLPLVKSALAMLADQLRPTDRVSIVVYAGNAGIVLEPTANKAYMRTALDCLQAGGSTAGGEGIKLAYDTARARFVKGGINRIFLATDGDFNVGISDTKALEALVKSNRDDGITLTTLGFGEGNYNDAMMEHIADVGNGNYAYIDSAQEAKKMLDDELSATLVPIAKDVKVQVEFNPAQVKQYRLIGYENRALAEEDFNNDAVDAGDMGAGHQVTALYEIMPTSGSGWMDEHRYPANRIPAATGGGELGFVKLRYKLPNESQSRLISRVVPASLMATATAPTGDMAFVTAVAAYGQKLRGDKYLGGYRLADATALAGNPQGYWRQEFVQLTRLADKRIAQN